MKPEIDGITIHRVENGWILTWSSNPTETPDSVACMIDKTEVYDNAAQLGLRIFELLNIAQGGDRQ